MKRASVSPSGSGAATRSCDGANRCSETASTVQPRNSRHILSLRSPTPPLPKLWIISAGRPASGLEGFEFRSFEGWPTGVYRSPRLLFAGVVVTSELPRERDTLLLRLMGAGACLRDAVAELAALPVDARERAIAGPVLLRCHIDIPKDPANRTNEDEEFMTDTQEIFEAWERETIAKGLAKGLAEGRSKGLAEGRAEGRAKGAAEALGQGLVVIYEIRFGTMLPELKTIVEGTKEAATLLAWIRLVETSSAETFAATVHASQAG